MSDPGPRKPAEVAPSARAVAKHLDRRQLRRKVILWGALIATIILAIVYLRCGRGWGLGGGGKGDGDGDGRGSNKGLISGPKRCAIVVSAEGITADGIRVTRNAAVEACKGTTGADVIVTGDARQGDWDDLKAALEAAKIEIKRDARGGPVDTNATPPDAGVPAPATGSGSAAPASGKLGRRAKPRPALRDHEMTWDQLDRKYDCRKHPRPAGCPVVSDGFTECKNNPLARNCN